MADIILHPAGAATTATLSATGAQAITIVNSLTIIDGVTTQATGNRTINLTIGTELAERDGLEILVKSKTAATETTVFGTGFTAPTITGEAGKTYTQKFTYDATAGKFFPDGTAVKID